MKNDALIIIPAFNPDQYLEKIIEKLIKKDFDKILVVNDGSNSEKIFEKIKNKAIILKHNENYGKGKALKTAFEYCVKNNEQVNAVITVDADGQHDIDDVNKVYKKIKENKNKVVLGSRSFENAPIFSKIGNNIINKKMHKKTKLNLKDTQTGLRAIPVEYLPDLINIPGERYEYETNMLIYFAKNKIDIVEEDIKTIYINKNNGSNFKKIKDSIRVYKTIKSGM